MLLADVLRGGDVRAFLDVAVAGTLCMASAIRDYVCICSPALEVSLLRVYQLRMFHIRNNFDFTLSCMCGTGMRRDDARVEAVAFCAYCATQLICRFFVRPCFCCNYTIT